VFNRQGSKLLEAEMAVDAADDGAVRDWSKNVGQHSPAKRSAKRGVLDGS
jgi:hypothetical protein